MINIQYGKRVLTFVFISSCGVSSCAQPWTPPAFRSIVAGDSKQVHVYSAFCAGAECQQVAMAGLVQGNINTTQIR